MIERLRSLLSSSTCIPIKSARGKSNSLQALPTCLNAVATANPQHPKSTSSRCTPRSGSWCWMEASFCIDAVDEAIAKHGCPQIFNTDQGSQFTSAEFISMLINNGISISMDGKGAWRDNVFVERFWRTVKYEEVYLHAYEGVGEARQSIARYIAFYNARRPHI